MSQVFEINLNMKEETGIGNGCQSFDGRVREKEKGSSSTSSNSLLYLLRGFGIQRRIDIGHDLCTVQYV